MQRNLILVIGKTGHGKSVWTKQYTARENRLIVYDPILSFEGVTWLDLDQFAEWLPTGAKTFRIGTGNSDDADLFGEAAFAIGDCTYVCEEASTLFDRRANLAPWMRDLIFVGRHRAVNMIFVAQRAASIPIDVRSQADRVISFAQHERDDLAALAPFLGEAVRELPALPPLHCLDYESGRIHRYKINF